MPRRWLEKVNFGTGFFVKNQDRDKGEYGRENINLNPKGEKDKNED